MALEGVRGVGACPSVTVTWPHPRQGHQPISPALCDLQRYTQKYDLCLCHTHTFCFPFPHTLGLTVTQHNITLIVSRTYGHTWGPGHPLETRAVSPALQWPCPHSPVSIPSHPPPLTRNTQVSLLPPGGVASCGWGLLEPPSTWPGGGSRGLGGGAAALWRRLLSRRPAVASVKVR